MAVNFKPHWLFGKEMMSFVRLSKVDNVVTATKAVNPGMSFEEINTLQNIPTGHKIASCNIKKCQRTRVRLLGSL